jgi:serine/threonine protein kinase
VALNLVKFLWDVLLAKVRASDEHLLGHPGLYTHKKGLLETWSKELAMARSESNVKYANKVTQLGEFSIEGTRRGTRPSRVVPNVRSIHFLRPEQVQNADHLGKGLQGEVYTCHILDCPLIPVNATLVAKRFKQGDKHKRRTDALQEVLMGGLNHRGIVGALAMTIEDPPRLVYDHYNGGDMGGFMDKCDKWSKSKGKSQVVSEVDFKFASEKKLLLENRLGIALALLETLQFLHEHDRFHCDLHFGNILLHFDHTNGLATRVYVGLCDFGFSKHKSQCKLEANWIWPTPEDKAVAYQRQFPQLASELVRPVPAEYSQATDVYALGNIFETLLEENWDGMSARTRVLSRNWNPQEHGPKLHAIIRDMMATDVKKRKDCAFWGLKMVRTFQDCGLFQLNSPFLRD